MEFKSKHEYLRYEIKKLIRDKKLKPGDQLPTELEFQNKYEVSRHTVRSALSYLENEGIIYKEQGLGSFVAEVNRANKTKEIGVITTYISDYIFPYIIRGIEQILTQQGYTMILTSTDNNLEMEKKAIQMMIDRKVDAVIVEPTKSSYYNPNVGLYFKLKERGIPIIMINATYEEIDIPVVKMDDFDAGYKATKNLIENNHTNIGGIFKIDDRQGKERLKGYMHACYEFGVEYNVDNVVVFETENYDEIMNGPVHDIIKDKRVTGLVCYNDKVAIELFDIVSEYGYTIPEDFSVTSFDNSYLSQMPSTRISSIDHPKIELGHEAAKKIIEAIEDETHNIESTIYKTDLIERSSVKKID